MKIMVRKGLMTAGEIAEHFGVKPDTIREWARKGVIPCHRLPHTVRFDLDEVARFTLRPIKSGSEGR